MYEIATEINFILTFWFGMCSYLLLFTWGLCLIRCIQNGWTTHYTIEVHAELLQKILLAINRLEWFVVDQPPEVFTLKSDAVSQHPHQFISNFLYPLSVPSAAWPYPSVCVWCLCFWEWVISTSHPCDSPREWQHTHRHTHTDTHIYPTQIA